VLVVAEPHGLIEAKAQCAHAVFVARSRALSKVVAGDRYSSFTT
jgi:hypothetical protein